MAIFAYLIALTEALVLLNFIWNVTRFYPTHKWNRLSSENNVYTFFFFNIASFMIYFIHPKIIRMHFFYYPTCYTWHPCMPFLCSVRRILSREIVTPVWLSTSLDNCSELHVDFLQPFSSEDAPDEVLTSVDDLDVSVRWLQFHLF